MESLYELIDDVRQVQAQAYLGIAGFCLLVYDMVITWDIEINLVWPAPLSLVKVLFLFNRYVVPGVYIWNVYMLSGTVTSVPNDSYCFQFFVVNLAMQSITTNGVGATLILLRVYALYNRNKRILALLIFLLLAELGMTLGVSMYASVANRDQMVFEPIFGTCALLSHLSWLWVVFLFMIVYDITVFVLILYKTWEHVRVAHSQTSLLSAMLYDGLAYFALMLAAETLNLVAFSSFSATLYLVGLQIMWCINTMMVSRIYLNLRSAARPQDWSDLTAFKTTVPTSNWSAAADSRGYTGRAYLQHRSEEDIEQVQDEEDFELKNVNS